jgi:hypothetical protein
MQYFITFVRLKIGANLLWLFNTSVFYETLINVNYKETTSVAGGDK